MFHFLTRKKEYHRSPIAFRLLRAGPTLKSWLFNSLKHPEVWLMIVFPLSLKFEKLDQNYQGGRESFQHFCFVSHGKENTEF